MPKNFHINPFELVYLCISIATFQHTAWGAGYVFEGHPPTGIWVLLWWLAGSLIAVAIDVGMLVTAKQIERASIGKNSLIYIITFCVAAMASYYFQVLYTLAHTDSFIYGEVSVYWWQNLHGMVDARVVLVPAILPTFAILYTLSNVQRHQQIVGENQEHQQVEIMVQEVERISITKELALQAINDTHPEGTAYEENGLFYFVCPNCGRTLGGYKSDSILKSALANHLRRHQDVEVS